jgi:hypothetical protein
VGPAAGRSIDESNQRMFIHSDSLLDIPLSEGARGHLGAPSAGTKAIERGIG